MSDFINYNLVEIALERLSGTSFENFANPFFSSLIGTNFIPLGGTKDGGADAFNEQIWEDRNENSIFYQASIQKDYKGKIKQTVKRLREFGRIPKRLIYFTSIIIPKLDIDEESLTDELGCRIRIRDKRYIVSHINENQGTIATYRTYLEPTLSYLSHVGGTKLISPSDIEVNPSVYVFLRQELERQKEQSSLVNALSDGLILWALEDTDPDKGILMSEREILKKIQDSIPSAVNVVKGAISHRLESLSKTPQSESRPVRKYSKQKKYCLSYEFRSRVRDDNAEDEALRVKVNEVFSKRLSEFGNNTLTPKEVETATEVSMKIIQKTFENQGIEFATFISQKEFPTFNLTASDYYDYCIEDYDVSPKRDLILKEAILDNLRHSFYNSTESERQFYTKLSSTYTLLFCLKSDPKIVEYFQRMATDFYLYVGTDLLVRALSERYLNSEDQITRNALKLIRKAGGQLILTEPVLEEVYTHIRSSHFEFINHYLKSEPHITIEIAKQSDRILIRAYFYAKLLTAENIKPPANWEQFISSFCDYNVIHKEEGKEQIRKYLIAEFGMRYEDNTELKTFTNPAEVEELSGILQNYKKQARLAENDALLTLAVYGRRRSRHETRQVSPYGYRTWWLTQESRILYFTNHIEEKNGSKYIMRPEFLVNFFSLAPSAAEIRKTFNSIFPTVLGVRIARRVKSEVLDEVLKMVEETQEFEPGRLMAKVADLSDKLKTTALEQKLSLSKEEFENLNTV